VLPSAASKMSARELPPLLCRPSTRSTRKSTMDDDDNIPHDFFFGHRRGREKEREGRGGI
jgi:hypothetical protein